MAKYILKEDALSHPFANGKYDHKNADINFILGHESYKEWLETLPAFTEQDIVKSVLEKLKADISKISIVGYATIDGKTEIARRVITQIIDKYITESENKDGNNNQHN